MIRQRREGSKSRKTHKEKTISPHELERIVKRSHNMVIVHESVVAKAVKQNHYKQLGHNNGGTIQPCSIDLSSGEKTL